jgi:signal transduction histidine kinase
MPTKILVVDDEQSVNETLRAILEEEGYDVAVAATLPEALAQIERIVFDVVLLDLRLGGKEADGLTVLDSLKTASPGTVAFVLTGYGSLDLVAKAIYAGAAQVLSKPVDVTRLKRSIATSQRWRAEVASLTMLNAELRRLAQERDVLRRAAERRANELMELDRLKDEFIAMAGHDLRNPLTTIRGFSQLLLRQIQNHDLDLPRMADGLTMIDANAAKMALLVGDLLDASRIQIGVLELQTAPCELGECLAAVLARVSPDKRGRIEVTLGDAPLVGHWEQQRIEQLLENLVENAFKYSDENQGIRVVAHRRPTEAEIEVAVSDHGIGIPTEELPRLFERFYRTPQALATGLSGTGLGLYICRGIVTAHGGRLWAESPGAGQGATFRFTLAEAPPKVVGPTRSHVREAE